MSPFIDLEAEISALGSMIQRPDILPGTLADLKEEDFTDQVNRNIFRASNEVFREGRALDFVTVTDKLREQTRLDSDHMSRVYKIVSFDIIPSKSHAEIVKKNARTRVFAEDLQRLQSDIRAGANIDTLLQHFSTAVTTAAGSTPKMTTVEDAIMTTIAGIRSRAESGLRLAGIPSGFSAIDAYTGGLVNGNLIILAGRPAMGKSTLALNIAENMARDGRVTAFFSLEMSAEELSQKIISRAFSVKLEDIRNGSLTDEQIRAMENGGAYVKKMPLYLFDRPGLTLAKFAAEVKALKMRKGLDFAVIDYLQLMQCSEKATRDLEISTLTRGLKQLAGELKIPVLALSQLNRGLESRTNKRPMLADLRESGAIEQDANSVLFIYRDEIYNQATDSPCKGIAEVIVSKQRMGRTGTAKLSSARLEFSEFAPLATFRK